MEDVTILTVDPLTTGTGGQAKDRHVLTTASQALGEGVGALRQVSQLLSPEQRLQLVQRWRARR